MGCGGSSPSTNAGSYPRGNQHGNQYGNSNNHGNNANNHYGNSQNHAPRAVPEKQTETAVTKKNRATKAAGAPRASHANRLPPVAGYDANTLGVYEKFVDFRQEPSEHEHMERPRLHPGELYVDEEFPLHEAINEAGEQNLGWTRPGDIVVDPVLISDGATRCDIGQGSAGTCYFLSMLALVSEKEELFSRVLPEDAYQIETDAYDGVFRCKFWKFGEWVDVYIDDFLPTIYDRQLWGAKSSTDENEMWPSLMEKSFARFHDGYNEVYGGQPGNAFLAMTGGVSEFIDFKKLNMRPKRLHERIRNSLQTGAIVSCSCPSEYDGVCGLVGGHAYSLTGAYVVSDLSDRIIPLLRVRNPWGHTEWTGAWSDGSSEWNDLPAGAIDHTHEDDGEFFMSLKDFLTYFGSVTICSVLPDFDKDGCGDALNFVTGVYGMWQGETAAGFENRLANPKYVFTLPEDGLDDDGKVPLVIQIIQNLEHRKVQKTVLRCDLYKVLAETDGDGKKCLELQGNKTNVYSPEVQISYRHKIEPGRYMISPSTLDPGIEQEYLIRVFTTCPLRGIHEVPTNASLMCCDCVEEVIVEGLEPYDLCFHKTLMGSFVRGENAGGQVSYADTYSNNPQFQFSVTEESAIVCMLMQEQVEPRCPLGIQIFPLHADAPVNIDYLYDVYEQGLQTTEGQQGKFVDGWDAKGEYVVQPGEYLALIHMDNPDQEKTYSFSIKSSSHIEIVGYQT